jgi:hypothetical protein
MKRSYEEVNIYEDPDFFIGYEVEHTPAYQIKTLFVVGLQEPSEILKRANALNCQAIYFGANMSFEPVWLDEFAPDEYEAWEKMIKAVLDHPDDFWCTLDFDVEHVEGVLEMCLAEHPNFIPMVSVKIPYASQLGYNATIKIDDKDFQASNPGVWCHKLHELMDHAKFTNWKKYKEDKIV